MNLLNVCRVTGLGLLQAKFFLNSLPPSFRDAKIFNCETFSQRAFRGFLFSISGKMRTGKTFTALSLAYLISKRFKMDFYSNTFCVEAKMFNPYQLPILNINNAVIVLDETHVFFNPRADTMTKETRALINYVTQFGKLNNILILISQRELGIDVWFREVAHARLKMLRKGVALGWSECSDYPSRFVLVVDRAPPNYNAKHVLSRPHKKSLLHKTRGLDSFVAQNSV